MARLVNVNFGHKGMGKLYTYLDNGNHRTGDEVVVTVTHPKTKKTYKTLAVIKSTHNDENVVGAGKNVSTPEYLSKKGIALKTITGGSQKVLPGYYEGWGKDADARKELEYEYRTLPGMTEASFKNIKNMIRRL